MFGGVQAGGDRVVVELLDEPQAQDLLMSAWELGERGAGERLGVGA